MKEYMPTIGLEIHAELSTQTKMFCDSPNNPDEETPNVNVCPICMGHPGTLPTINKAAVRHVLQVGVALGSRLADYSEFDRKNYFYPDIPKGYQISQYKYPLASGGELASVAIHRVHLEEDTARSLHREEDSLLDFNRAGVPLMELVTEPVMHSAEEASHFARELQLLLRTLGASHAHLEKGEMRVEANISVSRDETLGTKVEVKNLNSFKAVERAIAFEVARHVKLLENGGRVVQETRGWDEQKEETFSQRLKEEAHDYRYFPDPDLPKLLLSEISEFSEWELRAKLPELPWEARKRYQNIGLSQDMVALLLSQGPLAAFFDEVASLAGEDTERIRLAANYLLSDMLGIYKTEHIPFAEISRHDPAAFHSLIALVAEGILSSRGAKEVLAVWIKKGGDPRTIAETLGLMQESGEGALKKLIEEVIEEHAVAAEAYRAGKEASLQFLVGHGMRLSRGAANPTLLAELFKKRLAA